MQHFRQGSQYLKAEQFQKALPYFDACIKQNFSIYDSMIYKAICLSQLKRFNSVVQTCEKAISLAPEKQLGYHLMAKAQATLGAYAQAQRNHKQALKLNPKFSEGHYAYGYTLTKQKKFLDALESYQKGIARDRHNNPKAYLSRAQVFAQLGQMQQAHMDIEYAKRACSDLNDIPELFNAQKQIVRECLQKYKQVMQKLGNISMFHTLGRNYKVNKQKDMIRVMSHSINLSNINILESGYQTIMHQLNQSSKNKPQGVIIDEQNFAKKGQRGSLLCNCEQSCQIF